VYHTARCSGLDPPVEHDLISPRPRIHAYRVGLSSAYTNTVRIVGSWLLVWLKSDELNFEIRDEMIFGEPAREDKNRLMNIYSVYSLRAARNFFLKASHKSSSSLSWSPLFSGIHQHQTALYFCVDQKPSVSFFLCEVHMICTELRSVAEDWKVVLREKLPPSQAPFNERVMYIWQAQLQAFDPALIEHAAKCTFLTYKMRTPNNSFVLVLKPTYDVTTVPPGYLYDCHTYAMGCYDKLAYLIQSGSVWDVYNDDPLATKIVHNEPEVVPARTGQLKKSPYDDKKEGRLSILKVPFPTQHGYQIQKDDIMVFWTFTKIANNWYITGWHSVVIESPIYEMGDDGHQYLTLDTLVRSKDGSADPVIKSLDAVTSAYGRGYLIGNGPVGVYRLVCFKALTCGEVIVHNAESNAKVSQQ
jgi:hypothetical protein